MCEERDKSEKKQLWRYSLRVSSIDNNNQYLREESLCVEQSRLARDGQILRSPEEELAELGDKLRKTLDLTRLGEHVKM